MGLLLAVKVDEAEEDEEDADELEVVEIPLVVAVSVVAVVGEAFLDVEALAALTKDSAMAVSGGHKFVVCTNPLSKLKQSKTAAPTELRRATIELTMVHLFRRIS